MTAKSNTAVMPDGTPILLAPGTHSSPREGVCVVELASVIADEEFSDRPRCVCPVIGAFLRGWNDRASHTERQRLAPYAALIVGSRSDRRVTRRRRDICLEWAGADLSRGVARRLVSRAGMRIRIAVFCGVGAALRPNEGVGDYTSRVAVARDDSARTFELLDTLLAVGEEHPPDRPVVTANGNGRVPLDRNGQARVNGNGLPAVAPNGLPAANGDRSSAGGSPPRVEEPAGSS